MRVLLSTLIVFLASPAFAQSQCDKLKAGAVKDACYDSARQEKADESKSDSNSTTSAKLMWKLDISKSAMTDDTDVFMSVQSNEIAKCMFGAAPVTLQVRCRENTTSVYLITQCHMASGFGGYGEVTYRVDERPAVKRTFEASTDNRALGLRDFRLSKPFIDDIMGAKSLIARFTPYGENPKEVSFDISGFSDVLGPLRRSCGW